MSGASSTTGNIYEDTLRLMSQKLQAPGMGFLIIPFLRQALRGTSLSSSNTDSGSVVRGIASRVLDRYISNMTPLKSSWAGQPALHSPSGEVLSHDLEKILDEERRKLDDRQKKHLVDSSKEWLFRTLADAIESKTHGLERVKHNKFTLVLPGNITENDPYVLWITSSALWSP